MPKHPTNKNRKRWQRRKKQAKQTLEVMKLKGEAAMVPEEALDERVTSPDPAQPGIIAEAVRNKWAVPDEIKPRLVDELVGVVIGDAEAKVKVQAVRVLNQVDKDQFERDHPEQAGRAKGPAQQMIGVGVPVEFDWSRLFKDGRVEPDPVNVEIEKRLQADRERAEADKSVQSNLGESPNPETEPLEE